MSPESSAPDSASAAQVFVQATIAADDLANPAAQAEIVKVVGVLDGVESVSVVKGKLHVCYDPVRVSEKEIEAAIARSGHPAQGGEIEQASFFTKL